MISPGVRCLLAALWLVSGANLFHPSPICIKDPALLRPGGRCFAKMDSGAQVGTSVWPASSLGTTSPTQMSPTQVPEPAGHAMPTWNALPEAPSLENSQRAQSPPHQGLSTQNLQPAPSTPRSIARLGLYANICFDL